MRPTETATLADPTRSDEIVRRAGTTLARGQDIIARLVEALDRSRALRVLAQELQDQALRFRYRDPGSRRGGPGPARRKIENE